METKGVEKFIEDNNCLFFQIQDNGGNSITSVQSVNIAQSQSAFCEYFDLLESGRYKITGGENCKAISKKPRFPFSKGVTATTNSNNKAMTEADILRRIDEATAAKEKEIYYRLTLDRVDKLEKEVSDLKTKVNEVIRAYNLNNDEDETNDTKEMIKPVISAAMGKVASGISSFNFK